MKYAKDEQDLHKDMKPIERTRTITESYYECPMIVQIQDVGDGYK